MTRTNHGSSLPPSPTTTPALCAAVREPRNNYDEAAHCQMPNGHPGPYHCQTTPWVEVWYVVAPSAPLVDGGAASGQPEAVSE